MYINYMYMHLQKNLIYFQMLIYILDIGIDIYLSNVKIN